MIRQVLVAVDRTLGSSAAAKSGALFAEALKVRCRHFALCAEAKLALFAEPVGARASQGSTLRDPGSGAFALENVEAIYPELRAGSLVVLARDCVDGGAGRSHARSILRQARGPVSFISSEQDLLHPVLALYDGSPASYAAALHAAQFAGAHGLSVSLVAEAASEEAGQEMLRPLVRVLRQGRVAVKWSWRPENVADMLPELVHEEAFGAAFLRYPDDAARSWFARGRVVPELVEQSTLSLFLWR